MLAQSEEIVIKGARVHNLQNISLNIPRNKLVVLTGLSGSGKSSLAFDTLYAEGQRRYVESLSAYARQFLGLMDKPDVDRIDGLPPAISIDQKSAPRNPRSTVGTVTEIYDYARLLWSRTGTPHCPQCGRVIERQTVKQMAEHITAQPSGQQLLILAPLVRDRKGDGRVQFREARTAGYARVRVDGVVYTIEEAEQLALDRQKRHSIDVVVDRYFLDEKIDRPRLLDSLETAVRLGEGLVIVQTSDTGEEQIFSERFSCAHCGLNVPSLEPRDFSFNSPHGACPACTGLGTQQEVEPELVMPNKNLSLAEGALKPWSKSGRSRWYERLLGALAESRGFSMDTPVKNLKAKDLEAILYGTGELIAVRTRSGSWATTYEGIVPHLKRRYSETESDHARSEIEQFMVERDCPACQGKRLKPAPLAVLVAGKSIDDVVKLSIDEALGYFKSLAAGDDDS